MTSAGNGTYTAPAEEPKIPCIFSPIGYRCHNECGYCKGKRRGKSCSYYISTTSLPCHTYNTLLNHGFRRSGTLLYKPDLRHSCCAQYTIRLPAPKLHVSKDQRQAVNRFNRFILGEQYLKAKERCHPKTKEERKRYEQRFDLVERIHEAEGSQNPPLKVGKKGDEETVTPEHELVVELEPSTFAEEKYQLYAHYQKTVHNDTDADISRSGFTRFLCTSPLPSSVTSHTLPSGKVISRKLGSYHQTYRLNGRLVALAVLDLLPHAVSAVYFLYDESLHKLSPGKLSALREAALAVEGGYEWYMMGYYIHSCTKMRYKGDYRPMEVLDPAGGEWHQLEEMKPRLDEWKYVSLVEERNGKVGVRDREDGKEEGDGEEAEEGGSENGDREGYERDDDTTPLWDRDIPGILCREQVEAFDLDNIRFNIRGRDVVASDLVVWDDSTLDDPQSVKCWIGELVAAVGVDVAKEMVVKF